MADLLTSDQVNYLIWRYLQESGFRDSAYAFQRDSKVDRLEGLYKSHIRPGLLVYLVQRGLQYEELTSLVDHDGTIRKADQPFQFFPTEILDEDEGVGSDNNPTEEEREDEVMSPALKSPATVSAASAVAKRNSVEDGLNGVTRKRRKRDTNGVDGDVPMPDAPSPARAEDLPVTNGRSVGTQIEDVVVLSPTNDALMLSGAENGGITSCAWNPTIPTMLATVNMRCAAVQIWTLPEHATSSDEARNIVLSHEPPVKHVTPNVTIIKWSHQGDRLASGSYDGQTRIWSTAGVLLNTLWAHSAPISSCKWNKAGSYVCVMACDGKTIVWDAETGDPHQAFKPPPLNEALVEFEWISDSRFVGGGDKGNIYLHDIGEEGPLSSWLVHNGGASCLAWDEPTETIATGGQDSTILVWRNPHKQTTPENKLRGHDAPIVSIVWQQRADHSRTSARRALASASEDRTVRLWDVETMSCLRVLNLHLDPVECICFTHDGTRLASAANGAVVLWDPDTGAMTHVYDRVKSRLPPDSLMQGNNGEVLSDMDWDESGQRLALGETGYGCTVISVEPR